MAFSLFNKNNKTINLEINDYSIRYAEMKPGKGKLPEIQKSGEFLMPSGIVRGGQSSIVWRKDFHLFRQYPAIYTSYPYTDRADNMSKGTA